MNDKIPCSKFEKKMISRCCDMQVDLPNCYVHEDHNWYRIKDDSAECKMQQYACLQLNMLVIIRNILLWILWLPIVAGILIWLF